MKLKLPKKEQGGPGPKSKTLATATVSANAIITNDPNDPRIGRYRDSATIWNAHQALLKALVANPNMSTEDRHKLDMQTEYSENTQDATSRLARINGGYGQYAKPKQPVIYQPPPKDAERTGVQQVQSLTPGIGAINPGMTQLPQAGGATNFSFTGRDDNGQQTTRYFPDLSSWQNATDTMGYRERSTTNSGQQANATGYQFNKGGLMRKDMGGPGKGFTADTLIASARSGYKDARFVDDINYTLSSGNPMRPGTSYDKTHQDLLMDAYLWRKTQPIGSNPEQYIQQYYGRPVDQSNPIDTLRQAASKVGYDPTSMYHTTPDANQQERQGRSMPTLNFARGGLPQLANVGATGPQNIPDWASNVSQGFIHNSTNLPNPTGNPQLQQNGVISQQYPDQVGTGINWDHVLGSQVAQNVASGLVSRFSPNSQQNTIQNFNKNQFSPLNFLPYTANTSLQAQYGTQNMQKGGLVKAEFGGDISEEMRKWILDDDTPIESTEEQPVQEAQTPEYNDALEYANYMQMFPDQTEEQDQPEEQYMYKKGGAVKKYAEGGIYSMSKKQLISLRSMGYEIDEI